MTDIPLTVGAALTLAEAWIAMHRPGDVLTAAHASADAVAVAYGPASGVTPVGPGPLLVSRRDGGIVPLGSADAATLPPMREVDLSDPDERRARWMDLCIEPPETL